MERVAQSILAQNRHQVFTLKTSLNSVNLQKSVFDCCVLVQDILNQCLMHTALSYDRGCGCAIQ